MSAPAGVPGWVPQIKRPVARRPGASTAARAPPPLAISRHRTSVLSPTRPVNAPFQFQEIKHT